MLLPATQHALYLWNAVLLAGYVLSAAGLDIIYRRFLREDPKAGPRPADWLFNGMTFSASVMVAMGIYDENILKLIGDTTGYLTLACMAGLGYSVLGLLPHSYVSVITKRTS